MNAIEIVGKSKEDAVEKALKKLGLTIDQVEIEVIAQVKPFLGFIGKAECKVKVTPKKGAKKEESLEDFDITADFFKTNIKEEKRYEKPKPARQEKKAPPAKKAEEIKKPQKEEPKKEEKIEPKIEPKPEEIKPESIYRQEEVKRIDLSSVYKKEEEKPKEERPVKIAKLTPEIEKRIKNFLDNILEATQTSAEYKIELKDESIKVSVSGEESAKLIGRRGDALDALQLLIGLAANKGEEEYTRVIIDIEDYRQKREESIIRYANKMARQAAKQKRAIKLDVMNPYERRIVHASLQNDRFVTTSSEGKEPYRRVVIMPKIKKEYSK